MTIVYDCGLIRKKNTEGRATTFLPKGVSANGIEGCPGGVGRRIVLRAERGPHLRAPLRP